jgi:hypothetical protein
MARVSPSQKRNFLDQAFPSGSDLSWQNALSGRIGAAAGFLDLYDGLPGELIRLPPDKFAELIESVGEIRFRSKQYMYTPNAPVMGDTGRHLSG